MQKTFALLVGLALAAPVFAQPINIGEISVAADTTAFAVSVSAGSAELQSLALQAFNAHGKFRLVQSGGAFAIRFDSAGANQVTVTVSQRGSAIFTQTVAGTSTRNALLKAADAAVTKTTGLPGIFAGKLAFVTDRGGQQTIMTSDLFFGEVLSHPVQGKNIIGPRWSPDGSRIIFTSYRTGFPDIYLLNLRTRSLDTLVSFKGTNSGGRFSPDGSRLAMVLSGEGNPEIYVGNAQGRQIKRLTNNQSVEASPAWSPDGSRLVFTSDAAGGPQLYVMPAGGGQMSRLTTNLSRYCAEPDWSRADPNKVVFTAGIGRGYQIGVYDFSARTAKQVSKAPYDAVEPVWCADGRHVVCTFRTATNRALFLLDTETGKATRLSPNAAGNAWNAAYLAP
ncbi:biopolymer transporter Tol [Oleiharenicola sp. Vm1]|uniref:biopolymer transporter Tol n=1 Tax=Oleiharenicola sp. Vm1 TaxID=3398393 RepID=UPI0039F5EE99